MDEIRITLETLYDILRNEKKREELQKLEETFFIDVVAYLREKKVLLESKANSEELFAAGEMDKLEYELRSIKRILKEIYEKREKKIIDIAMNKSRTGSDIIDTSSMLREEKEFYKEMLVDLDKYRKGILGSLFLAELPNLTAEKKVELKSNLLKEKVEEKKPEVKKPENITKKKETESVQKPLQSQQMTKIKFIHPMPSFVWKDMKVYGPFEKGDETEIFPEVAELIVRKGRAEKV